MRDLQRKREARRRYNQTPRGKFKKQRERAKVRGVPFELTFPQWWGIWRRSGKWSQRGRSRGKYCMCRKLDAGSYAIRNVYIGLWEHNVVERNILWRHTARTSAASFPDDCPF